MRVCYTCKGEKPLSEFYKGKCYKDGYDIYCKDCAKARRRDNLANPKGNRHTKRLPTDTEFWCARCKSYRPKEEFYTDNSGRNPSGYVAWCKPCDNARHKSDSHYVRNRKWYNENIKSNPEKLLLERTRKLEVWRRYKDTPKWRLSKAKKEHLRRERVRNSEKTLTESDIEFLINFQNNRCASCGREFTESLGYQLDHILPVSKGGGFTLQNVQLLCKTCNCSKGNKMILYRKSFDTQMEVLNG
jgi:hypothetical protein